MTPNVQYRDINKKFSTRYYLNLILVDEENRRYFKQQEITVYRKGMDENETNDKIVQGIVFYNYSNLYLHITDRQNQLS